MKPIVQISLDLTNMKDAVETAAMAVRAGVDFLEAGTPLILAEGLDSVRILREHFPDHPIVADLKTMDGGYLEAEMMIRAGATHVVVMARAHEETIRCVVQAGRELGGSVMGDNLACPDMVEGAVRLAELGCETIVHHIGFDERRGIAARGEVAPTPLDQLRAVVNAVNIPVQAVGGLSPQQAIQTLDYGAELVVFGAPFVIQADSFEAAGAGIEAELAQACAAVHARTIEGARS